MAEPNTLEDISPHPESPQWVAIIECTFCGYTGTMRSTHEPRENQFWDCENCGAPDAPHEMKVKSNTSETV